VRKVSLSVNEPGALDALPGVRSRTESGGRSHLLTTDADELVRTLVSSGTDFTDLEVASTSLEEAFLSLTGDAGQPADSSKAVRSARTEVPA
jgi:ABC-2 type transport system ATP-binding protein